jgi:hypothetical protein
MGPLDAFQLSGDRRAEAPERLALAHRVRELRALTRYVASPT